MPRSNRLGIDLTLPVLAMLALSFGTCRIAMAQQTIINVPSDALTPKGRFFLLHESQVAPASEKATYATTNFFTYGLWDHTELAATLYAIDDKGSEQASLGLGFKSTFPALEGVAPALLAKWTGGFMLPLAPSQEGNVVGWFPYTHLTYALPGTPMRLLSGVAAGSKNLFGKNTLSALGGIEMPIYGDLMFTGEWFSGHHELSGLIPGATYHRGDWIFVAGYKIPNDFDWGESAVVLEAGLFFGGASEAHDHYGVPRTEAHGTAHHP